MTQQRDLPNGIVHFRCANPGPMTLTGTNTYIVPIPTLREDTARQACEFAVAVIDPGPPCDDATRMHYEAVLAETADVAAGGRVAILLTHHHDDHRGGVEHLAQGLRDTGHEVAIFGTGEHDFPAAVGPLRVLRTPGHTRDSACFLYEQEASRVLFTGDTVLGGSSSFVAHPDGNLTAYLGSLELLEDTLGSFPTILAPGHGVIGHDAATAVQEYRRHRQERLDQVAEALERIGPGAGVDAVINTVYPEVGPQLRPAVEAIVRAQLEHLSR